MVVKQLLFEQHKIILKWYRNFENVCELQTQWQHEFTMEPPTQLTTAENLKYKVNAMHEQ
jgi:hypothetical protein